MKKLQLIFLLTYVSGYIGFAQQAGDTIVVSAFKYGSSSRDTLLGFPSGNLSFEKIILKYNMRCKNALVSTQSAPDQGCGEWDYSCNTFIVDSSRIEQAPATHPSHTISGFSGTTFLYSNTPLFDYKRYKQYVTTIDSIVSENQYTISSGISPLSHILKTNERSGRSQVLLTAQELTTAGITAGPLHGLMLDVANTGGTANFLKIGVQHTSADSLSTQNMLLSGFQNVYICNTDFVNGLNRLQFHTPFLWDGVSNLLIDMSFTNTNPGQAIVLNGSNSGNVTVLTANNNYALDLSANGVVRIDSTYLSSINSEITVAFWSYGNPNLLPANTTILYGWSTNPSQRQLNIHLPWANSTIFFDCGFSGTYDRIQKAAQPTDFRGKWNHWAFTKNAGTGNMSIFLNGNLWHSGSGLTKTISFLNLLLGNQQNGNSNYKGKVKELSIWNKALPAADIQHWMNMPLDSTHFSWANLVAYYRINEGSGTAINDSRFNMVSSGTNINWTYDRGDQLVTVFSESSLRPSVKLFRGTYMIDSTMTFVWDSVQRSANNVRGYSITPAPSGVIQDDAVTLISTMQAYNASPISYSDGDADSLLYLQPVTPDDSVVITSLPYLRRFPWYNEILSFVTPYGKGLDLGVSGKTWYFDVTDFTPLLKGNKRMMMTGGIWQEELDIDFLFIVGTPPREVLEFNQLWQGSARDGQAGISSIINNIRFPVQNVSLNPNGKSFKMRAVVTGHGSEGEFHQNGGLVNHYLRVNSTSNTFSWQITEECSFNPVFPQGGTWVYDRQGWCPGQVSLLKEFNITPFVSPGSNATIDYACSNPSISSGDYRYLASFQLVTYGNINHTLDANLVDVAAPTNKVVYSRSNPICANPVIVVQNTGATNITSLEIEYWLNQATTKQSYIWTGNLAFADTALIMLPTAGLWQHGFMTSANVFHAEVIKANGVADNYAHNNKYSSPFTLTDKVSRKFIVEIKTNNYPSQNSYSIFDEAGNKVSGTSNLSAANTIYRDTLILDGCFTLKMIDSGGDGLQWWANSAQGSGYARLRNHLGIIIKTFQPDFGGGFEYSFYTFDPLSVDDEVTDFSVSVFPNPANDKLYISSNHNRIDEIAAFDFTGRRVLTTKPNGNNGIEIDVSSWPVGIYFISVLSAQGRTVHKVLVE